MPKTFFSQLTNSCKTEICMLNLFQILFSHSLRMFSPDCLGHIWQACFYTGHGSECIERKKSSY
ncbi:unnamed protein product [Ixodes persulcatus]